MTRQGHVRDSLKQINDHTWLLGGRLLIVRSSTAPPDYLWHDSHGSFYSVSEASTLTSPSQTFTPTSSNPFELVYDVGDAHVVWKVGNAFVKVIIAEFPDTTREHVTLAAVKAMSPSFTIPDVLYHGEWCGRYYLIVSALPGKTLTEIWPNTDEATKVHLVDQVVQICNELARHQADYIGGVDRGQLSDLYLARFDQKPPDLSHRGLLEVCMELGMDCSTLVFFHCDLGPGNIIVAPDGSLGVIDWETAGFVPKDWIRTKFRVSTGLDLPGDTFAERGDWRKRVQVRLGIEGYTELAQEYMASMVEGER